MQLASRCIAAMRLTEPYPFANISQVFQTDPAPGAVALRASGLLHNCLADTVVDIIDKPTLTTRTFLQQSFGRLDSLLLELLTQLVDVGSRVAFPIVGGGNIDDAQVNTHIVAHIFFGGFINVVGGEDIELAPDEGQVALTLLVLASQCPDRDFLGLQPELEDAIIVGERAVFSKLAPGFAIFLVAIGHLCGQLKSFAHIVVTQVMQFVGTKEAVFPSQVAYVITGRVRSLQRFMQQFATIWVGIELDFRSQFHVLYLAHSFAIFKQLKGGRTEGSMGSPCPFSMNWVITGKVMLHVE